MKRVFNVAAGILVLSGWMAAAESAAAQASPPGIPALAPKPALPSEIARACDNLFDIGMADPRTGEYRAITVVVDKREEGKTDSRSIQTHGWVLPTPADGGPRRAICWNGLVYPVTQVGAPADPAAQIRALLKASPHWSADPMRPTVDEALASNILTVLKIPLLLRLGQNDLTAQAWNQWKAFPGEKLYNEPTAPPDFFVVAAREWIWGKFVRGRTAHLCDQPQAAVADLQDIPAARKKIEAFAAREGIQPAPWHPYYQRTDQKLDLAFLNQVPALLADDQRRVIENVTNRDKEIQPNAIPDKKQRIALLIRDLEDVEAEPMISEGYIDFGFSPVVTALARQGEDAVDPLLDCLEHDPRLTRSIDGGAHGIEANGPARIVGVEEPAFYALQAILKTQDQIPWLSEPYVNGTPGGGEHLGRVELAKRIRAYWNKMRGVPVELRWVQTLKDDNVTSSAWAEAATNLARPAYENMGYGGIMVFNSMAQAPKPGERPVLAGDSLRGKTTPSIGDLIAKRLRDAVARRPGDKSPFPSDPPRHLAAALAAWDAKGQLSTLRWWCDELKQRLATELDSAGPSDMEDPTRSYLARIEAGDPTATSDYAQWIRSLNTKTAFALTQLYSPFYFAPVYSYSADPVIRDLTHWLFENPDSPWSIGPKGVDPNWVATATHSGLVAVSAFRALLLQQLTNKNVAGKVEITKNNVMVTFHYGNYGSCSQITDPETPPDGFRQDLRLCDIIACRFSELPGFPRCEPYWPLDRRDAAIAQTIAFLQKYGDRLARKATSDELTLGDIPFAGPLRFDKLDHPATKEEADSGRAIFSLEGQGECRLISLPDFPQRANWITPSGEPSPEVQNIDPGYAKDLPRECTIWQAEEMLVNGQWQPYYGVVAPHKLAMVPGNEIEIIDPSAYDPIGHGWALRIDVGPQSDTWEKRTHFKRPVGQPVPISAWLRNMRGADAPFPQPTGKPPTTSDDVGFRVSLTYTSTPRPAVKIWWDDKNVQWQPVTPKQPLRLALQPHPSRLESLQATTLLQFNAADYFDLSKPGTYRLRAEFGNPNPSTVTPSVQKDFEITNGN